MQQAPKANRTDWAGIVAFGCLVLASYAQFLVNRRYDGTAEQLLISFAIGAVYSAFFLLAPDRAHGPWRIGWYLAIQCALLTLLFLTSTSFGFLVLLVLPVVSQSLFIGTRRTMVVVSIYLYAMVNGIIWARYGAHSLLESSLTLAAGFAFAIMFTVVTVRATEAQARSEQLRTELETAHRQLQAQTAQMEELATVRERNRLAREIHDGVGHYLTVIKVQLDAAVALLPADPVRAADSVGKASRMAAEALEDVRSSVRALAEHVPTAALPDRLRELAVDGTPAAELRIEGALRPLPAPIEHALFRASQEGLTNIRKHAQARSARLTLDFRDARQVRLEIVDDGCGESAGANGTAGVGLRGLRDRIAPLGGRLTAGNRSGGGFALTLELPA